MTGPEITVTDVERDVFRFTLPGADWSLLADGQNASLSTIRGATYIGGSATVADAPVGDAYYYRNAESALPDDERDVRRVADRTIDGVEGAVFEGSGPDRGRLYYQYVARHEESLLRLKFEFPRDNAKARSWIEAVLASGEWL